MTIGIGALATDKKKAGMPNTIVLMADTMGSYGDEFSHERLHKTFEFHEVGLYATSADRVDRAELLPMIANALKATPEHKRSYGEILRLISVNCFLYKAELFRIHVLPDLGIKPDIPDAGLVNLPAHLYADTKQAWETYRIGCDLIIGAFDNQGMARLYTVNGRDETASGLDVVANSSFPGFAVIGSGAGNAEFWMSRRGHSLGMGVKRACYHAYEAKLMAESTPTVNYHLDLIIAQPDTMWSITTHKESEIPRDCPVTFKWLKTKFKAMGFKPTVVLDRQK